MQDSAQEPKPKTPQSRRSTYRLLIALTAMALILAAAGAIYISRQPSGSPPERYLDRLQPYLSEMTKTGTLLTSTQLLEWGYEICRYRSSSTHSNDTQLLNEVTSLQDAGFTVVGATMITSAATKELCPSG